MSLRINTALLHGPGIVAVSGGADSVALLIALHEANAQFTVAHINHQLRGEQSDADEQFVIKLANRLNVPVRTKRIDVLAEGGNLEANARKLRYEWLGELATELNASWIATGHNANDQAETVLHRLIRGTGLQGLRGIAASRVSSHLAPRDVSTLRIIRPLLGVTRAEILQFLAERNQVYCTDATNADTRFTRNRIRHELLPMLQTFNPGIVDVLCRLANQAEEQYTEQEAETVKLLQTIELPRAGVTIVLSTVKLKILTDTQLRNSFRHVWQREGWPMDRMSYDHWQRLVDVVQREVPAIDMPSGVKVVRKNDVLLLNRSIS